MATDFSSFVTNGFIVLKNVVSAESRAQLYYCLLELLVKYNRDLSRDVLTELQKTADWESPLLSAILVSFRKKSPELFGALYDTVQLGLPIAQLITQSTLTVPAGQLINSKVTGLAASGPMLRMDPPNDTRNSLDWHQDSAYYTQNLHGENGIVLWIPMHRVNSNNGGLLVCPGSHNEKKISVASSGKTNELISEQYRIPSTIVNKYQQHQIEADGGDAVILSMDLLHRSGSNSSNNIRFVAGVRYHKMLTDDFLPGKQIYQENTRVGRMSDYIARTQAAVTHEPSVPLEQVVRADNATGGAGTPQL